MFINEYIDIAADDQATQRANESELLTRTINSMIDSDSNPTDLTRRIKTLHFIREVWTYFLNDLASQENATPAELKASLISIGIFIIKHLEKMRSDTTVTFEPLVEITETIRKGLN